MHVVRQTNKAAKSGFLVFDLTWMVSEDAQTVVFSICRRVVWFATAFCSKPQRRLLLFSLERFEKSIPKPVYWWKAYITDIRSCQKKELQTPIENAYPKKAGTAE